LPSTARAGNSKDGENRNNTTAVHKTRTFVTMRSLTIATLPKGVEEHQSARRTLVVSEIRRTSL
jgi:hypothetical protein